MKGSLVLTALLTVSVPKTISAFSVSAKTTPSTTTTPEQRAESAKTTWERIALAPTSNRKVTIDLKQAATVTNAELYKDFTNTITGTYFINGLASCQVGDRLLHPFEAHGFVKSIAFDGSRLHLKTAIVETPLTVSERFLNMPLARGVMSRLNNPILNAMSSTDRNTANLSATLWPPNSDSSILIVAGDNGEPYAVNARTLQTIGKLSDQVPALRGKKLLAHSRIDEKRQRLILCSSKFELSDKSLGRGNTVMEFLEFGTDFQLVSKRTWSTRFMVFHDWMITDNYYIVPKNPAEFNLENIPKFLIGLSSGVEMFDMDESSPGELVLIPRHDDDKNVLECVADSFFNIFHFGPCFEEDDSLTVYASVFDSYKFGGEMGFDADTQQFDPIAWSNGVGAPAPRLEKFVLDLKRGVVNGRDRIPLLDTNSGMDVPVDMPTFNGDGNVCRYSYFVGGARPEGWFPFRSVVKADLQAKQMWNWDAGDDRIVSEPMFVPRTDSTAEDDGFVLSIVHSASDENCVLMVWDSQLFDEGPIASVDLGELMPWCVHGSWNPGFVAD